MLINQLNEIIESLGFLKFEIALALGAFILLIGGLLFKNQLVIKSLFVLSLLSAAMVMPMVADVESLFGGSMLMDQGGNILRLLMVVSSVWIVFFPTASSRPSEFYFILLSVILGSSLMLSANNLLVIYLAVELASFGAYLLTNFNFEKKSFEAGIKYLVFGGVTSALALYGASLIYGFSGTLSLSEMDLTLTGDQSLLNAGIFLFCGSLLFKISAVPFHIWTPSAYQVAPTEAVMVMSLVPKIGGLYLLHRFLVVAEFRDEYWLYATISAIGMATIALGTLGALRQANFKRMIAYGAIAHSGFLIAPFLIPTDAGASSFIWYAIGYALINIALFYLVAVFEEQGFAEVDDFAGLGKKSPFVGGLVLIVMISLIGLPPTLGFTIKFYLFIALWELYQSIQSTDILIYLLIAFSSVIFSLFFYLKIPYQMFLKDANRPISIEYSNAQKVIATIFCSVLLWLFFSPEILNNIANSFIQIDW